MRYRTIDVRLWGDEKFRSLSPLQPSGQALFLYLLVNPNTTSIPGIYRAGAAAMAEELGWTLEAFRQAFDEVLKQGLVEADLKARVIFIPNAIKYNKPQSPNVVKSWLPYWDELPECNLKEQAHQALKAFVETLGEGFAKAFRETFPKPSAKTMPNQKQDQEQEQNTNISEAKASPCPLFEDKLIANNAETDASNQDVQAIFSHWQQVMKCPKAKLDQKRRNKIGAALKLGYSVEELKLAIDGCASTPFNMGDNDRKRPYNGIDLIFRDAEHIEQFLGSPVNHTSSTAESSSNPLFAGVI